MVCCLSVRGGTSSLDKPPERGPKLISLDRASATCGSPDLYPSCRSSWHGIAAVRGGKRGAGIGGEQHTIIAATTIAATIQPHSLAAAPQALAAGAAICERQRF